MWKKWLITICWGTLGASCLVFLVAAREEKEHRRCKDIKIYFDGSQEFVFLNENDVREVLKNNAVIIGTDISMINTRKIEEQLEKTPWVNHAELFFDNNSVLYSNITERKPIARVFTLQGNSFYLDNSLNRLPLSEERSARVPMFTSFPSGKKVLSSPDSLLLLDVKRIAQYINSDSFWIAQVGQVDIAPNRTYEIIPVLGNQVIELGGAENLHEKFSKLFAFYQQIWSKTGFEKYEKIDVRYWGQVVATRRNTGGSTADTTHELISSGTNSKAIKEAVIKPGTVMTKKDVVDGSRQKQKNTSARPNIPGKQLVKTVQAKAAEKHPKAVMKKPAQ